MLRVLLRNGIRGVDREDIEWTRKVRSSVLRFQEDVAKISTFESGEPGNTMREERQNAGTSNTDRSIVEEKGDVGDFQ
jgi:hypothetical protein